MFRLSAVHQHPKNTIMLTTTLTGFVGSAKFVHARGKTQVLNINLASNRRVGEREFTDWVSAKVWGERAEKLANHIHKGMHLLVTGRPEARGFKKADGTPAGELVLHVAELEFLSAKSKEHNDDGNIDITLHDRENDDGQLRLATID
jgi:single-stranded DNA-binding protein